MEPLAPIPFPAAADAAEDVALNEVDVAIALVSAGAAVRVRVAGIEAAIANAIAETATARTRAARVALSRRTLARRDDVHRRATTQRRRPELAARLARHRPHAGLPGPPRSDG